MTKDNERLIALMQHQIDLSENHTRRQNESAARNRVKGEAALVLQERSVMALERIAEALDRLNETTIPKTKNEQG